MSFPDDRDRQLIHGARRLDTVAAELSDWVSRFSPQRDQPAFALTTEHESTIRHLRRTAANLLEAARHPVAAAIYGPSQAGKSLLVGQVLRPRDPDRSPLGRDERHGAPGYLAGLSFDVDINPQSGSNEATAMVTRFTTNDRLPDNLPPDFPVVARALNRGQLLRVLARGFAMECTTERRDWNSGTLAELLAELGRRYPATTIDLAWQRDLLDAYAYMHDCDARRFAASEQELAGVIVRHPLTREGYLELAGHLFWDRSRSLTGLFLRIEEFLASIDAPDHEPGLLVSWGAVRFLLDSKRAAIHERAGSRCFTRVAWSDFRLPRRESWPVLEHCPGAGAYREPLETIQAALLELVVPVLPQRLREDWRQVLEQSDLLDIPGLRAGRQGAEQGKRASADTLDEQLEILKRGKVAYLFEHYTAQLQIQTLLVLARGGNLEVTAQLKHHVDLWGRARYGAANWSDHVPAGLPALSIGLTGVDEEFRQRSEFAQPMLYDIRLAQLADALAPAIRNFGGAGKPFTNIYPLRYPGAWDACSEQQQREGAEKWVRAGEAFLGSSAVMRHVANPAEKWAAAMRDDDGGLSLVSAALRAATTAHEKQQHLATQLDTTHQQLLQLAKSWLISPDGNAERDQRLGCAQHVLEWLMADARLVHDRVDALKHSFSIAEGEQYPLTDGPQRADECSRPQAFAAEHFGDVLRTYLDNWAAGNVAERWDRHTRAQRHGAPWLTIDIVGRLSAYLRDYFLLPNIFDNLAARLWQIVSLKLRDESARREARRRYVRVVLNDLIWTPGLPSTGEACSGADADGNRFGSMTPFVRRWQHRLPAVLAASAGDVVQIPPGNEELSQLLGQAAMLSAASA